LLGTKRTRYLGFASVGIRVGAGVGRSVNEARATT
jgi:hypothetical protein